MFFIAGLLLLPGENEKFDKIYNQYKRLMHFKANEILRDYNLSEDAVSEAFIRIFRNLHKLDDEVPSNRTAVFVVTVVKNVALTILKKEKHMDSVPIDEDMKDERHIEENVISDMTAESIMATVNSLGDDLKDVFLLYYTYEMSHKEIASVIGITANTAAVRLHRAKKKLIDKLSVKGGNGI